MAAMGTDGSLPGMRVRDRQAPAISNPAPGRGIAITDNLPAATVEGVS